MWPSEECFVDRVAGLLPAAAGSDRHVPVLWREQRTGYGRPDVLLIDTCPVILSRRLDAWQEPEPLTRPAAYAMAYLQHRRWTKLSRLASFLRVSIARAEAVARQLVRRGLALRRNDCVRARAARDCMIIQRVVAVEAKLREWRRAVAQAQRHLWFARESYVLLASASPGVRERVAGACRASGVGLIVPDGASLSVIVRPARPRRPQSYFGWLLNEQLVDSFAASHPN